MSGEAGAGLRYPDDADDDAGGQAPRIGGQALSVTHPARVRTTGAEAEAVSECNAGRLANGSLCKLPGHVHSPWWCEFCPHPEICAPAERCFAEQHGLNYDTDEDGAPRG